MFRKRKRNDAICTKKGYPDCVAKKESPLEKGRFRKQKEKNGHQKNKAPSTPSAEKKVVIAEDFCPAQETRGRRCASTGNSRKGEAG